MNPEYNLADDGWWLTLEEDGEELSEEIDDIFGQDLMGVNDYMNEFYPISKEYVPDNENNKLRLSEKIKLVSLVGSTAIVGSIAAWFISTQFVDGLNSFH